MIQRLEQALTEVCERIVAEPHKFKVCEGCERILATAAPICPLCKSYRFDSTSERVQAQARKRLAMPFGVKYAIVPRKTEGLFTS